MKKYIFLLAILTGCATTVPAEPQTCFSPTEVEKLETFINQKFLEYYKKGFEQGIAHEQSTI